MIVSRDATEVFMPKGEVRRIILGTMAAINARALDGQSPGEVFFYHNPRNHFWRVLQMTLEPNRPPNTLTLADKRSYLQKHGLAMANLVNEIDVSRAESQDPSDEILFQAHAAGRLRFKTVPKPFMHALATKPVYFTCRAKPGLKRLLQGFCAHNAMDAAWIDRICFWPTPTRCNPQRRADVWRNAMHAHESSLG